MPITLTTWVVKDWETGKQLNLQTQTAAEFLVVDIYPLPCCRRRRRRRRRLRNSPGPGDETELGNDNELISTQLC